MTTPSTTDAPLIVGRWHELVLYACFANQPQPPHRRCLLVLFTNPGTFESPRATLVPAGDNVAARTHLTGHHVGLSPDEATAIIDLANKTEREAIARARELPFIEAPPVGKGARP
jgi:hypothetical protein